MASEKISA